MLQLVLPEMEYFNETDNTFVQRKKTTIVLEHSLVSVSKWEAIWKKPFLSDDVEKTNEEVLSYIQCMTITQNVPPDTYQFLTKQNIKDVVDYISDSRTATWFTDTPGGKKGCEVLTSEVLYYNMIALEIPFECQRWHLQRLLTLMRVCNEKNTPPKKLTRNELAERNRALNEARKKKLKTKG